MILSEVMRSMILSSTTTKSNDMTIKITQLMNNLIKKTEASHFPTSV